MKKNIFILFLLIILIIFIGLFLNLKNNYYDIKGEKITNLNSNIEIVEEKKEQDKNINLEEKDDIDSIKLLIKKEQENIQNNIQKSKEEELLNLEKKKIEKMSLAKNSLKKLYLPRTKKEDSLEKEDLSNLKYIEIEYQNNNFLKLLTTKEYKNFSIYRYNMSFYSDLNESNLVHNDFPINSNISNRFSISIEFNYNENRKAFDTLNSIQTSNIILNDYLKDIKPNNIYKDVDKAKYEEEHKNQERIKNNIVSLTAEIERLKSNLVEELKTEDLDFNQTLKIFAWDVLIKEKLEIPKEVFIWTIHSPKNFKCDLSENEFVHSGLSYSVEYDCPELPIINDYDKTLRIYFN